MAFISVIRVHDNMKFNILLGKYVGQGDTEIRQTISGESFSYLKTNWGGGTGQISASNFPSNCTKSSSVTRISSGSGHETQYKALVTRDIKSTGTDILSILDENQSTNTFEIVSTGKRFSISGNRNSGTISISCQGQTMSFSARGWKWLNLMYMSNMFSDTNYQGGQITNNIGFGAYYEVISDNYHEVYSVGSICLSSSYIVYALSSALTYDEWLTGGGQPADKITNDNMGQGGFAGGGGIGAGGTFDGTSSIIEDDLLPSESLADIGFVTTYTPTLSQLRALAQFMWSNSFFNEVIKMMSNLTDCIIGCHILPFKPASSGTKAIIAGNVATPVSSAYTNQQFHKIECGYVTVKEFYGNYLDYAPYTQIEISLPFIGSRALDVDEVMGKVLGVRYKVDIATGAFVCVITADGNVLYQFTGACAVPIPITGSNYSALISDTVRLAIDVGKTVATSGATAGALVSDTANMIGDLKPSITRSGNLGGASGFLAKNKPYLIIKRPRMSLAETYIDELGYPCNASYTLGSLSGFTRCEKIELKSATATSEEYAEIERMLCSEGVIL